MTVVESVLAGMERLLLPKLERIEAEQKALRELMEEKLMLPECDSGILFACVLSSSIDAPKTNFACSQKRVHQ
jgi:hypothetical protein